MILAFNPTIRPTLQRTSYPMPGRLAEYNSSIGEAGVAP